jgi:hypothetical protein
MCSRMLDYATIMHPILVEKVKRVRDQLKVRKEILFKSSSKEQLQTSAVGNTTSTDSSILLSFI